MRLGRHFAELAWGLHCLKLLEANSTAKCWSPEGGFGENRGTFGSDKASLI